MSGKEESQYRYGENKKAFDERKKEEREARERRAEAYKAYQKEVADAKKNAAKNYDDYFTKKSDFIFFNI